MKRKINLDKKPISSSEINATKNFDALVKKITTTGAGNNISKTSKINSWLVGGITTLAVATIVYFTINSTSNIAEIEPNAIVLLVDEIGSINQKLVVNPLLTSIDVPNESYKINADKGGLIKHHTGTEITIPAIAFEDEEGNIITGEVEIQYREFHDQAEIFLSGIPMEYDTAGEKAIFESAGMMEIKGFQDGKRLKIVTNKNFNICMYSKNSDPKFNLYSLDETKGKWNYEGKDSISNLKEEIKIVSDTAVNDFEEFPKEENNPEIKEVKKEIKIIEKEIVQIKKTKPTKPVKATKTKKNFTIDVVKSEYPELVMYSGTIFEVKNNEDMSEDVYSITWSDVKLKQEKKVYKVELTKGKRKEIIPVLDGENYKEALVVFEGKYGEYKELLQKKEIEEKKAIVKLEALKKAYIKQRKEYQERIIAQQKSYVEQQKNNAAIKKGRMELKRIFNIKKLGIWNCDSPSSYPKGMMVKAFFTNEKTGEELKLSRLDLIERNRNACFSLPPSMQNKFAFNPRKNNLLWAVTIDGKLAFTNKEEFKKIKKGELSHVFKMKVIDVRGKKSGKIKEMILN